MLKDYLQTAKEDLEAKKEILDIKQQRLNIAQDEFHLLRHAYMGLDASRTSRESILLPCVSIKRTAISWQRTLGPRPNDLEGMGSP